MKIWSALCEMHSHITTSDKDCSQTLFEFRASNPRALNVLEGSGVFATYKLQTNFRSNQEILDFANVLLANIEANQYAKIQLQANNLSPVTEDSFMEKVNLYYERMGKVSEFEEYLGSIMSAHAYDYIQGCLDRKEQIAFLAFKRSTVYAMKDFLERNFPDKVIADIMPERPFDATTFSTFICKFWDQVEQVSTTRPLYNIIREMMLDKLEWLIKRSDSARPNVERVLDSWIAQYKADMDMWQAHYHAGTLSKDEFFECIRNCLIEYEIEHNAIRNSLMAERNKQAKLDQENIDADFVLSTIHSAKGLEFDNAVVVYQDHKDDDEEKKRMHYVAFTRAKNTELVLAYGLKAKPKIMLDYESIVNTLHERDAIRAEAEANAALGITV